MKGSSGLGTHIIDRCMVAEFFTWHDLAPPNYREIDTEFSRWGNASEPNNAQYVIQPFTNPGNLERFPSTSRARMPTSPMSSAGCQARSRPLSRLDSLDRATQVTRMMITPDAVLPATTVKRRFLELLRRLGPERSVITITRDGVPAGVLMSVEELDALMETLEILAQPKSTRALSRARANFRQRRTLSHDEVWRD